MNENTLSTLLPIASRSETNPPTTPAFGSPTVLHSARIAHWQGAQERGTTGLEALEGYVALAMWEVPAAPDFSSPRFPDLAGLDEAQRVQRVGLLQNQWLAALHPLGPRFGISLRYVAERVAGGDVQVRLFVIGRSFGTTASEAAAALVLWRETFQQSFPPEYRLRELLEPSAEGLEYLVSLDGVQAMAEVLKPEQTPSVWHDPALCGFSFYYYPLPFTAAENDMIGFCQSLLSAAQQGRIMVDVTLVPTPALTNVERMEVNGWGTLCEKWGKEQRIKSGGGLYSQPRTMEVAADPHAVEAKKAYQDIMQRYGQSSRYFLYAVRVLGADSVTVASVATALNARALAAGSAPQIVFRERSHPAFERALNAVRNVFVTPAICNERLWQQAEAPETLRRLHRLADMKEIAGFFRLPIPGRDGCPGMPLDSGLPETEKQGGTKKEGLPTGLRMGRFVEGLQVREEQATIEPADLAKHALIVGTPGSGKTSLCFSLLTQLWDNYHIPFLVLEPAKTEYRALQALPCFRDEMLIFTVGNERIAPLRFNPLEVPEGVSVAEHIAALNTCFAGAFNLFDPLPMLLDKALRQCYAEKGWSEYGLGGEEPDLEPPTLSDLHRQAMLAAESSLYKGETAGNIRGALETRLGALLRGPKGRCFNTRRSIPLETLLERPVVLELEALNDEEKALLMLFLLTNLRAYARAKRKSGAALSHLVLVEEAHNLIGRGEGAGHGHTANPKEVAVRFFTRMLAEMRALGEGVVIADQLPTALAPEAVKSTNLKVMHRLVAADDREELGQAMALDGGQFQQAATLPVGHSFVFREGWSRSRLVQEPNFKADYATAVPPEDGEVAAQMMAFREQEGVREIYLPYRACGAFCPSCNVRIRETSERWTERKRPEIEREIREQKGANRLAVAASTYFDGFAASPDEPVRLHCARVHFTEAFMNG